MSTTLDDTFRPAEGSPAAWPCALFGHEMDNRNLCNLFGHAVHVVTVRGGLTEYACGCGHSFLLARAGLTRVTHPWLAPAGMALGLATAVVAAGRRRLAARSPDAAPRDRVAAS